MSRLAHINASIVQGSVIGPASYVVEAFDLHPRNPRNVMSKFADDTYLLVGSKHLGSAGQELQHVTKWAESNNLRLNPAKTRELIVFRKGVSRDIPPTTIIEGAERVTSMRVLGVTISSDLSMEVHLDQVLASCASSEYALRQLRSYGRNGIQSLQLHQVAKATTLASL